MSDVRTERGKLYGHPRDMHDNIGTAWTAVLRSRYGQHMPALDANIVAAMMAAFKVVRIARPVPTDPDVFRQWADSPVDAKVYCDFALETARPARRVRCDGDAGERAD